MTIMLQISKNTSLIYPKKNNSLFKSEISSWHNSCSWTL